MFSWVVLYLFCTYLCLVSSEAVKKTLVDQGDTECIQLLLILRKS